MKEIKYYCDICGEYEEPQFLNVITIRSCNSSERVHEICTKCRGKIYDFAQSLKEVEVKDEE